MAEAKLGSGERFAMLKAKLAKTGKVDNPGAAPGRKKPGSAKMAAAGKKE